MRSVRGLAAGASARRSGVAFVEWRRPSKVSDATIDRLKHCASMRARRRVVGPARCGRPRDRCAARAGGVRRWSRPARLPAADSVPLGTTSLTRPMRSASRASMHSPGDDQFDRAAVSEDAGEPLRAAVGQPDVPAPAGDPERGVLVGDRHVGPARPLQPAGIRDAVDGGDGGLVDVGPPRRAEHAVVRAGASDSSSSPANAAFRSPPAQNAVSPAPVRTPTRAVSSARKRSQASISSRCVCGPMAFMRSGRLMVMIVTGPRCS